MVENWFGSWDTMPPGARGSEHWVLNNSQQRIGVLGQQPLPHFPIVGRRVPGPPLTQEDLIREGYVQLLVAILKEPDEGEDSFSASRARAAQGRGRYERSELAKRGIREVATHSSHQSSADPLA